MAIRKLVASPVPIVGENDRGDLIRLPWEKDILEIIDEDLRQGKRVLNKSQLWKIVDNHNSYLKLIPKSSKAKSRTDINKFFVEEILKRLEKP